MDTGLTLKPAASLAQMSDQRPDPARNAVAATELAPAKTVTAASGAARTQASDQQRMREVILDPHSREVIYRVVNVASRRVVRQVPEEVKLRLRAYARPPRRKRDSENGFDTTV